MRAPRSLSLCLATFLLLALASLVLAQEDPEPGKDYPLASRMPNFRLENYEQNYNEHQFPMPNDEMLTKEGNKTEIVYGLKEGAQQPSPLQIVRNYTNLFKQMGGEVLFDGEHGQFSYRTATIKLVKNGQEIWVHVEPYNNGDNYRLCFIEVGEMKQEVQGGPLRQALEQQGRVTLYINFDTGKATIRPDSQATIAEVAQMLKDDPALKLRVDGHTDNQGQPAANLKLSLDRANSVAQALIAQGIEPQRLAAAGYGQAVPLADNGDEAGRAKNRRVELVKM